MKGSVHEKLRWIFRFYDKDCDGFVSRKEITEVVRYLMEMTSSTLDIQIDADGIVDRVFDSFGEEKMLFAFEDFKTLASRDEDLFKMLVPFSD